MDVNLLSSFSQVSCLKVHQHSCLLGQQQFCHWVWGCSYDPGGLRDPHQHFHHWRALFVLFFFYYSGGRLVKLWLPLGPLWHHSRWSLALWAFMPAGDLFNHSCDHMVGGTPNLWRTAAAWPFPRFLQRCGKLAASGFECRWRLFICLFALQ